MFAKLNYVEHVIKTQTQDVNIYEDVGRRSHNFGSREVSQWNRKEKLNFIAVDWRATVIKVNCDGAI